MPPFRFHIPFFSSNSPSRLSSGASSPSPPPTPPPSSRPPFRPAGIAPPSKSSETKLKASPSLSRVRSNVAAIAASLSAAQYPSRGAATPTRLAKQTNQQPGSPSKKLESQKKDEEKVTMKEKPSRETGKVASESINPVTVKPPIARPEEHLERKETDSSEEQRKKTEAGKQVMQEKKKDLPEGSGEKPTADQGQQKRKELEKLALQESKKDLPDEGKKSEADKGQQKRKEKAKLALEETKKTLQAAGREDVTQSKTTRHIAAASEPTRGPSDLTERDTKTQNKTEFHTDDNHQKTKGASTSNLGNPRVPNGQGSSSMSRKIKEDIKDGISKLTWGKSNGDEKSVNVYTLTGENRGATMGIGSEKDKKDGEVHIRRGYRSNPDESPNTTATETEGGRKPFKGKNPKDYE
ncbi:PREDICTED: hepatoma-derived growth factor-related protein 2-like, partial [Camelina sativa]|uniref:Hepatoma-derived growth factor-related protein 2-like n=1 Tax=Camelina sativa TaxID=90675 RepID=A0ABM1Q7E2_CAMSA